MPNEDRKTRGGSERRSPNKRASGLNRTSRAGGMSTSSFEDMSKTELYQRAQKLGIKGRSSMNKEQLMRALKSSQPDVR